MKISISAKNDSKKDIFRIYNETLTKQNLIFFLWSLHFIHSIVFISLVFGGSLGSFKKF